ncbi:MAG: T9SS C-terminal target domain-containing protein [Calditrichaeota bacterium]|nr:MAG: T9SS C-terminal target domain-containing protein [Calditrichota bacterium]
MNICRAVFFLILLLSFPSLTAENYVILGWNDLGMHCANKDFQNLCILPPYNTLVAQVIRQGDHSRFPQLVTLNLSVTYEIPGNTASAGKTNFWSYEDKLFGFQLPDDIGLTGKGLGGVMEPNADHFEVAGIPITPYSDSDLIHESPYQLALMKVYDAQNNLVAATQNVIPVSNEINCVSSGCHPTEIHILNEHEDEGGFNPNNRPILCANCHASAALGKTGKPGIPSLSLAIHDKHKNRTSDCYRCHPGSSTRCLRDVMYAKGMGCPDCHGSVANVAETIKKGRRPWLDEPKCGAGNCHGSNFSEQPNTLFRLSRGHGNLFCSACHGSPHAIVPTIEENDNLQNLTLQGQTGTLKDCRVCHGYTPAGKGPHNISVPVGVMSSTSHKHAIFSSYPNPFNSLVHIRFKSNGLGNVRVLIYGMDGRLIRRLIDKSFVPGDHEIVWDGIAEEGRSVPSGIYVIRLVTPESSFEQKVTLLK